MTVSVRAQSTALVISTGKGPHAFVDDFEWDYDPSLLKVHLGQHLDSCPKPPQSPHPSACACVLVCLCIVCLCVCVSVSVCLSASAKCSGLVRGRADGGAGCVRCLRSARSVSCGATRCTWTGCSTTHQPRSLLAFWRKKSRVRLPHPRPRGKLGAFFRGCVERMCCPQSSRIGRASGSKSPGTIQVGHATSTLPTVSCTMPQHFVQLDDGQERVDWEEERRGGERLGIFTAPTLITQSELKGSSGPRPTVASTRCARSTVSSLCQLLVDMTAPTPRTQVRTSASRPTPARPLRTTVTRANAGTAALLARGSKPQVKAKASQLWPFQSESGEVVGSLTLGWTVSTLAQVVRSRAR